MANTAAPVTGYPVPSVQRSTNQGPNPNNYHLGVGGGGIAYPAYPAPPPPPHNGYYNPAYPDQSRPLPRAVFLRRFIVALIAFFVAIGAILFIVRLVLRPRIPEFRVDSLSATALNVNDSQVSGTWRVGLTATNPNKKMHAYYDEIRSSLGYRDQSLAVTSLPPFDQGTRDQTALNASFAAASAYVDPRAVRDFSADKSSGTVRFEVTISSRATFRAGAWRPRRRFMRVYCTNLPVSFTSNGGGNLSGGSKDCTVTL